MRKKEAVACFEQAADCLPVRFRRLALTLPVETKETVEELRLRAGRPMTLLLPEGESAPWEDVVGPEDLETVLNMVTEYSRYAAAESMRNGYLSAKGGCRIGLCGTAVMKDGGNTNLRDLSSLVIRVAREKKGVAEPLIERLLEGGRLQSTLVLAPPGAGKTTLLRDLVRCLSSGGPGRRPLRVSLVDERGEIAVMVHGLPQMDIGTYTDVLDACPKAIGIPMVLRAMNPQVIAVDEITAREDLRAMTAAANCGVALLATIHGANMEELTRKPLYWDLLAAKVFQKAIRIENSGGRRTYQVEELPC